MSLLNNIRINLKFLICIVALFSVLAGCAGTQVEPQTEALGNPTPEDYLDDGNADIFVLNEIVYSNVEDVEWVKELNYTIGKEVGEIVKQTDKPVDFVSGTSNKLPIGTKIYKTDTQIYIAIVGEKEIPYLKMIEG